jgi:hypothetical protein
MSELRARWDEIVKGLEQERDELRVKLHLAKSDAKDEMAKLDVKLDELRAKVAAFDKEGDGYLDDIRNAARDVAGDVANEVREGFEKLKRMF